MTREEFKQHLVTVLDTFPTNDQDTDTQAIKAVWNNAMRSDKDFRDFLDASFLAISLSSYLSLLGSVLCSIPARDLRVDYRPAWVGTEPAHMPTLMAPGSSTVN